jgi:hypothetical protein
MTATTRCVDRACPTVGVDAVVLDRFADVGTDDGQRLVYDRENETAWIQSDLHVPRALMA